MKEVVEVVGAKGMLKVDVATGRIVGRRPVAYWFIEKFDLDEFKQWSSANFAGICGTEVLETIGFWMKNGTYRAPDAKARAHVLALNEGF